MAKAKCEECWTHWGFPRRHKNCGGLVHCHYLDENYNSLIMQYFCDKCGKRFYDSQEAHEESEEIEDE